MSRNFWTGSACLRACEGENEAEANNLRAAFSRVRLLFKRVGRYRVGMHACDEVDGSRPAMPCHIVSYGGLHKGAARVLNRCGAVPANLAKEVERMVSPRAAKESRLPSVLLRFTVTAFLVFGLWSLFFAHT